MANNEDIEGDKEDFAGGHLIQYSIRYRYFFHRLPFAFERSFNFECNSCPTSWTFQVDFAMNEFDRSLFCTTVIRRTDDDQKLVQAVFRMRLFAFPLQDIPEIEIIFCTNEDRRRTKRTSRGIMQYQDREQIDEQGVLVQVSFAARACHIDEDLQKLIMRRKAKETQKPDLALRSKM